MAGFRPPVSARASAAGLGPFESAMRLTAALSKTPKADARRPPQPQRRPPDAPVQPSAATVAGVAREVTGDVPIPKGAVHQMADKIALRAGLPPGQAQQVFVELGGLVDA